MQAYSEKSGRLPAFEVAYRFYTPEEGGRNHPPFQYTLWDFLYEGDHPQVEEIHMIWPESLSETGAVLPEEQVPMTGKAHMFIADPKQVAYHQKRIRPGVRAYFVEGPRKVAECEVTKILNLAGENAI